MPITPKVRPLPLRTIGSYRATGLYWKRRQKAVPDAGTPCGGVEGENHLFFAIR